MVDDRVRRGRGAMKEEAAAESPWRHEHLTAMKRSLTQGTRKTAAQQGGAEADAGSAKGAHLSKKAAE